MLGWSSKSSLDLMNLHDIRTSILSLSAPAITIVKDNSEAASLAYQINEYAASLRDEDPFRFGFFATLPNIDNTAACITEITHSLDVLKADGVTLFTSYSGKYLGHLDYRPLWDELDRRAAVVFIHPNLDIHTAALREP